MPELLRAVFDTNVLVAAMLSKNLTSPTRELLERAARFEFTLLISEVLTDELIDKLIELEMTEARLGWITALLARVAEQIAVPPEAIPAILPDPDDNLIFACAVVGHADYLVTYDPHFKPLGGEYQGLKITQALPFLWAVRGDQPPEMPTTA